LLDELGIFVDIKGVLGKFSWDTWHVFGRPCENIPILTEELDELAFLCAV
jgi:hypothetical protein